MPLVDFWLDDFGWVGYLFGVVWVMRWCGLELFGLLAIMVRLRTILLGC